MAEDERFPTIGELIEMGKDDLFGKISIELKEGSYYRFDPPFDAWALPVDYPFSWHEVLVQFTRARFLGRPEHEGVYQGKGKFLRQGQHSLPHSYPEDQEYYFHGDFWVRQGHVILDPDQSP